MERNDLQRIGTRKGVEVTFGSNLNSYAAFCSNK